MEFAYEPTPLLYAGVLVFGALIGSFLNVIILRVPKILEYDWRKQCRELLEIEGNEESGRPPGIILDRSHCPNCGHNIRWYENIPILSFLILRGKCSACKKGISLRYPLVELVTSILFFLTIWHFGFNLQGVTALVLTGLLIVMTGIDIDHQLLPDNLTLPLLWAGVLLNIWDTFTDLSSSVIGAIGGYLFLWSIYHIFRILTGKEGMGYGDFKLLAALGAWMGWQMLPLVILLSSVAGAIIGLILMGTGKLERDKPMPFGPFIAIAGWAALIWGDKLINVYVASGAFG